MTRLLLALALVSCATLPHPIERSIASEYGSCAKGKMRGGLLDLECRDIAERECKDAKLHETCFYDYRWSER